MPQEDWLCQQIFIISVQLDSICISSTYINAAASTHSWQMLQAPTCIAVYMPVCLHLSHFTLYFYRLSQSVQRLLLHHLPSQELKLDKYVTLQGHVNASENNLISCNNPAINTTILTISVTDVSLKQHPLDLIPKKINYIIELFFTWNILPERTVNLTSKIQFKKALRTVNFDFATTFDRRQ